MTTPAQRAAWAHDLDAARQRAENAAAHGDRAGQHSIRINDQWRVCFVWTHEGPSQLEIVDYH